MAALERCRGVVEVLRDQVGVAAGGLDRPADVLRHLVAQLHVAVAAEPPKLRLSGEQERLLRDLVASAAGVGDEADVAEADE